MKHLSRILLPLFIFALSVVALLVVKQVYAGTRFGSGEYINICGSGLNADGNGCGRGCNVGSGTCSASGPYVVKFTCDGKSSNGQCLSNEETFATSASLNASCGKTVQIDVFNKKCRDSSGNWVCGNGDLQDYIVWYSGDCSSTSTPTPTPTPGNRSCNSDCSADSDCASGLTCYVGYCRNRSCFTNNTCNCGTTPTPTPTPTATPYPTPTPELRSSCDSLQVVGGNNSNVPANVTLRARASTTEGGITRYRYYFGDGKQEETTNVEIQHRYESSGSFLARVDAQDSRGNWRSSSSCEAYVYVNSSPVESHRSGCSNLFINNGNNAQPPTTVSFTLSGYDNKGGIQNYKMDFGNGIVKETTGNTFEQRYDRSGTYTVTGWVKDSQGNWKGGDGSCKQYVYVNTKPLTNQPKTGTPAGFTATALGAGVVGLVLLKLKKRFAKTSPVAKTLSRVKRTRKRA